MTVPDFVPFGWGEIPAVDVETARIVVLPLPYENAVSYGTGSATGPFELLAASLQLETIDEETLEDWGSLGIYTLPPIVPARDPETAVARMRDAAGDVLGRDQFLLSLGGDHSVSIGPIAAAAARFSGLGVLQVDAHLDLRESWNGSRYNHACVMRRVIDDMGLPIVQVAGRSFCAEEAELVRRRGLAPIYAHLIDQRDEAWIERVVSCLPPLVYLTIDLDGLDPSALPGTGTPEPGGLLYRQLVALIKAVGRQRRVVAADITELAKIPGSQVSEYTAAKIATKIFVHCANRSSPC
jgi:agmatinase